MDARSKLSIVREIEIVTGSNRDLVTHLANNRARFFVAGSTATRFHTPERRPPNDLDLLVEPSADMLVKLNAALACVGAPTITATPEHFCKGNGGIRSKGVLNVDILTPPTGVNFAEHWAAAEEVVMNYSTTRLRVASNSTMQLLLRIGQEREPSRAPAMAEDIELLVRAADRETDES